MESKQSPRWWATQGNTPKSLINPESPGVPVWIGAGDKYPPNPHIAAAARSRFDERGK